MMRRWTVVVAVLLLFASGARAKALDPARHISQYGHRAWKTVDGLLVGSPLAITQTPDGYLWVGTSSGLFRFDGVRFVRWPQDGQALYGGVGALLTGRDGGLWIGSEGGVSRWRDGRLTTFTDSRGPVQAMVETSEGDLWFGRGTANSDAGPLCQIAASTVRCFGADAGVTDNVVSALKADESENLWIGGERTLLHGRPGRFRRYAPVRLTRNSNMAGISALALDRRDGVWVGLLAGRGSGLQRLVDGEWTPAAPAFGGSALRVSALFIDSDDALWIGTVNQGIYRQHGDRVERFDRTDGLSGDYVAGFYEDREGTLWVVTDEGIDQFRELRVTSYSRREGLGISVVDGVHATRDGTVWAGGGGALSVLRDGEVHALTTEAGLPGDQITSIFEDRSGSLWVGIDGRLTRYDDGRFTRVDLPDGRQVGMVTSMTEDIEGNVWAAVAGPPRSLLRIRDGIVKQTLVPPQVPPLRRVAASPDGSVWLGLLSGDLARLRNGQVEVLPFRPDPVPRAATLINQLLVRSDGEVLAATAFGLIGWREGRSRTFTVSDGLPCNQLFALVDDREGNLWLYAECGLVHVSGEQLRRAWADGAVRLQAPRVFDVFDGARGGWAPFQGAARSADGRLWFANQTVLQVVDPGRLKDDAAVPSVHIEGLIADRVDYSGSSGVRLPADTRDVQISYTAPGFVAPQKVRFRYRLEGHDANWIEAGTRRLAFYNDLPPGPYRFHVIASNHDGVWNESGAAIQFSVAPAWHETTAFRISSVVLFVAAMAVFYRVRVRRVATILGERFDDRLRERTRLARDLHDSLLQSIQASKMLVDGTLRRSDDLQQIRMTAEKLSSWLDRALDEGRVALTSLRSPRRGPNDLLGLLKQFAAETELERSMTISFRTNGKPSELHPVVAEEVASIGREAIRNAFVHSGGTTLEVTLAYDTNLTLRVRDDGVGIDQAVVTHGKHGHFGIQGMRERATALGGTLTVSRSRGMGTEVTLVLPGRAVFSRSTVPVAAVREGN